MYVQVGLVLNIRSDVMIPPTSGRDRQCLCHQQTAHVARRVPVLNLWVQHATALNLLAEQSVGARKQKDARVWTLAIVTIGLSSTFWRSVEDTCRNVSVAHQQRVKAWSCCW